MKIVDIADEICRDLEDDNLDIPKVAFWLRANIGKLVTLLNIILEIDATTLEATPELSDEEKDILKEIYFIRYYKKKANDHLGSAEYDWIEITEGDRTIRRANKTEVAKSYLQLKDNSELRLTQLVDLYKRNRALVQEVKITNC